MSEYKIEKGIPIPEKSRFKYPFRDMDVGDSVFIPGKKSDRISGAFFVHRPKKFMCRKTDGGIRVWRIE